MSSPMEERRPLISTSPRRSRSWLYGKQNFILSIVVISLIIFSFGYYETKEHEPLSSPEIESPKPIVHKKEERIVGSNLNSSHANHTIPKKASHTASAAPIHPKNETYIKPHQNNNISANHSSLRHLKQHIHHVGMPKGEHTPSLRPSATIHSNHSFTLASGVPPFKHLEHPIHPILTTTHAPYPTNAWWTSLLIRDSHGQNPGEASITSSPYTMRCKSHGLLISYAGDHRRENSHKRIREVFYEDLIFTTKFPASKRNVIEYDPMAVTVRFSDFNQSKHIQAGEMKAYLVRGSPYITVEYEQQTPVIRTNGRILTVNNVSIPTDHNNASKVKFHGNRFVLQINTLGPEIPATQVWVLYASKNITFAIKNIHDRLTPVNSTFSMAVNTLWAIEEKFTGILRAAVLPGSEDDVKAKDLKILDAYKNSIPKGVAIHYGMNNSAVETTFTWKIQYLKAQESGPHLLMMALPHQVRVMSDRDNLMMDSTVLRYHTVKGYMTAIIGQKWLMQDTPPAIDFLGTNPDPSKTEAVRDALRKEWNSTLPMKHDPYFAGKEFARRARFALIADSLNETEISNKTVRLLEKEMEPWMNGTNMDPFVYEPLWGGICSQNGIKGLFYMTDFGNGWYSDHHFHYGYFLYALAVIGRYDPHYIHRYRSLVSALVRDIANPILGDKYYPFTRHFSWYDGHSFASGVFVLDEGKSQESVSEAINAWYSIALLGKVMNSTEIYNIGSTLLTWEIKSALLYWQMPSSGAIYETPFAENRMVGQVAATRVSYHTWFGNLTEDMHLINILPFTPITASYLQKDYVTQEYTVLEKNAIERKDPKMFDEWKGYAYMAHAVTNAKQAWNELHAIKMFDDGNSLTNALYWIATQF